MFNHERYAIRFKIHDKISSIKKAVDNLVKLEDQISIEHRHQTVTLKSTTFS
jgi:hypothetical protein